jgi:hypothetical protein
MQHMHRKWALLWWARDSVQVRKMLPDNTTNDDKVVGKDTVNLKPSSGNGDRYVPALQVSSARGQFIPRRRLTQRRPE